MAAAKNIMIGIFVVMAIAVIIFILLFLHPSVGDNAKTLHVRFNDIDKVSIGTRVTYAGRPVGEVVGIYELPSARSERVDINGDVYVYELVLKVDSGVHVYNTDTVSIRTSGLLGERNIAIDPMPLLTNEKLEPIDDTIIYAMPVTSIEDTIKDITSVTKKIDKFLDGLIDIVDELKQRKVVANLAEAVDNVKEVSVTFNQPDKWNKAIDDLATLPAKAHDTLHRLDEGIEEFNKGCVNIHGITDRGQKLIDDIAAGKGSLGRIMVNEDLYLQLKALFSKGHTVLNDINHYGVLFQNNKRWQRMNARRLNLLERLSTPQEFDRYFNDELDLLWTSLSRVSVVLNETAEYPCTLKDDPCFMRKFAELIRRVEEIDDTLKMYNQQVIDSDDCCCPTKQ